MNDYDFLNSLKVKILEIKKKRDFLQSEIMKERISLTQVDEQIAMLQRERQKIQYSVEDKEMEIKKYNELSEQSEGALNKMVRNTQKLNEALNSALDERF